MNNVPKSVKATLSHYWQTTSVLGVDRIRYRGHSQCTLDHVNAHKFTEMGCAFIWLRVSYELLPCRARFSFNVYYGYV